MNVHNNGSGMLVPSNTEWIPLSVGRIAARIGNTLFLGFLGASAYFGYFTYRYTTPEVEQLIEERKKPENAFPGSDVSLLAFFDP